MNRFQISLCMGLFSLLSSGLAVKDADAQSAISPQRLEQMVVRAEQNLAVAISDLDKAETRAIRLSARAENKCRDAVSISDSCLRLEGKLSAAFKDVQVATTEVAKRRNTLALLIKRLPETIPLLAPLPTQMNLSDLIQSRDRFETQLLRLEQQILNDDQAGSARSAHYLPLYQQAKELRDIIEDVDHELALVLENLN